jgi:multidrug efflux pump subunit AcrB
MSGVVGRLFREFAVVLSVSIAISMVISLTAVPMMCAWLLKEHRGHGYAYNQSEKFYRWIISTYASALNVVLDHPASVLLILLLTLGVNVYLYDKIPKGFFPQQDTGRLQGNVQGRNGSRRRSGWTRMWRPSRWWWAPAGADSAARTRRRSTCSSNPWAFASPPRTR